MSLIDQFGGRRRKVTDNGNHSPPMVPALPALPAVSEIEAANDSARKYLADLDDLGNRLKAVIGENESLRKQVMRLEAERDVADETIAAVKAERDAAKADCDRHRAVRIAMQTRLEISGKAVLEALEAGRLADVETPTPEQPAIEPEDAIPGFLQREQDRQADGSV